MILPGLLFRLANLHGVLKDRSDTICECQESAGLAGRLVRSEQDGQSCLCAGSRFSAQFKYVDHGTKAVTTNQISPPPSVRFVERDSKLRKALKRLDPLRALNDWMRGTDYYPDYKAFGHRPSYLYWLLRGKPARIPHRLKQLTVEQYAGEFKLAVMIEAGTYYGEMVDAMKSRFQEIFSIEIDNGLAQLAKRRFARFRHIHILEGDSQVIIQELLAKLNRPALFWLDAGYYGFGNQESNRDRLTVELESILRHPIKEHVIVMDDCHGLNGENGVPTLAELISHLNASFPDRQVAVEYNLLRITPRKK